MNYKRLRQRFCKDYNLPINVFDNLTFQYYSELYDFFPMNVYEKLLKLIEYKYDGNVELWLDYCASVRDNAINSVMESDVYKEFNNCDLSKFDIPNICGERNCYTDYTNGKHFISIDLRKANFQALKYVGVINDDTYEEFIKRNGGDEYIANSKYLRQVIFGKMNPKRQIKVERHLMYKVYESIKHIADAEGLELFSFNSDEIIFEVPDELHNMLNYYTMSKLTEELMDIIKSEVGVEVRAEYVKINRLNIFSNDTQIDAYERINCVTNETKLKKASTTFFPQIYKLWKGMEIGALDRVFFFENQLATFNEPLIMK